MKTISLNVAILLLSIFTWSCSTNDLSQETLKNSITKNVQELSIAVNTISQSSGYQALTTNSSGASASPSMAKSAITAFDSTYSSIVLADISGIYNYKAAPKKGQPSALRFFTKSAENANMIVRLPVEKVKNPSTLLRYTAADTLLTNNYVIELSKYDYHFNRYLGWNYGMASKINIKNIDAGALSIQSSSSKENGYKYQSEFEFADGFKASCVYASGDTAVATYAISNGTKVLYAEKYTAIRTTKESRHQEKKYALSIGNVEIVREMSHNGLDSAKVYVGGILQANSKVQIIDIETIDATDNSVINHKRELKITFDDGTSSTISDLLGTSVTTIRNLFGSLRQASFATSIIDWIAWDIYSNK